MKEALSASGLVYRDSDPDGRAGDGNHAARPVLVLLHGWSCHGGFFAPQVTALAGVARLIVPDLPGHGRTAAAVTPSIEAAADALAGLLREQVPGPVVLAGWSMGAHVAYALAERHGTAGVRALVSLDMTPKVLNDATWSDGVRDGLDGARNADVLAAIAGRWPQMAERVAQRIFARGTVPDAALVQWARREIRAADPRLLQPMWASLTQQDFRTLLPALACPLHLVQGARSALYGEGVADWHRQHVPGVTVHRLERSGHAPHLEEPGRVNRLLQEVLCGQAESCALP
ncbi:alpha/beta fold hydrolase [Pannonibacter tanglangensis]|uniref:Alpha/beta fold hydrolase n=1 Tax=Pannonibacter tanglangensis TaxID=2750084 RepID=A0ABW9ZI81_9HYPH|nr:alpha/beta hydrolase [Pannonibacter sp. XCT-34]NBN64579.1 alpha/beta fold hydrolase [Pannonibacter sp. XCT-34]